MTYPPVTQFQTRAAEAAENAAFAQERREARLDARRNQSLIVRPEPTPLTCRPVT